MLKEVIMTSCDMIHSIPTLGKGDKYHVFISYSSGDFIWVSGLIHKLEETFPSLKICFHERHFVPGKTIIDNMVECIQRSQKTLMVLSPDFVRSRWCLFEANISMFQDCLAHKAIVPIMLKPCPVPLHFSHLTYLEAEDEQFFEKLSQVLLSNNDQVVNSKLVHYQPSFLYNGKTILTLPAVNEDGESWQPGVFSSAPVPDSLRAVADDSRIYKQAIEIINDIPISHSCLRFLICKVMLCVLFVFLFIFHLLFCAVSIATVQIDIVVSKVLPFLPIAMVGLFLMPTMFIKVICWKPGEARRVTQRMVVKTSQANLIFSKISVLAGCPSRAQIYFVYVSLCQCMETFQTTFGHGSALATEMWEMAIINYSSDYACCLARKHFPFNCTTPPGHLEDGICFCQYVATLLQMEK